ncbi:MAG: hypothetical protein E7557_06675 [Ruminococcaceae bacterium]|nr:hypothetical protein [Oscillospiraceae bacterium]
MTNYRETSAYDLSLFEPQVVEPRRVRETEPVRKQQVKKTPAKKASHNKTTKKSNKKPSVNYTRATSNTVRRAVETVDSHQHTVVRNSKKAAVSPLLVKVMAIVLCLFSAVVIRLFMFAESDKLDVQIAAVQNEISIAEGETVRLNAELNSMIDSQKAIEYAETKLGMVKAESYQITYIDLSEGDEFVVAGEKEVDGKGEFASEIKSLFAYIF